MPSVTIVATKSAMIMYKNDRRLMIMHFVKIVYLDVLIALP